MKKTKEQYAQRMKDQALNEALKNNCGRRNAFREETSIKSLEQVEQRTSETESRGIVVVKLQILGKEKKSYIVNPAEHILLGNIENMNDVVLNDNSIAAQQCDIFLHGERVYVRNLNTSKYMVLSRKGGKIAVEEQGIQLLTGDIVYMGNSRIQVTLLDYRGNTIAG